MAEQELDKIEGVIKSLIYKNGENGWTVARVELNDGETLVITGAMPYLGVGESICAYGSYVTHQEYGPQFSIEAYERILPATENGILDYLCSKTVKGIGPKTALALVEKFGTRTFEVLAGDPDCFAGLPGLSPKKARGIHQNFLQNNAMRQLLEFFTVNNFPMYCAAGAYTLYGEYAVKMLTEDPYLLCDERFGVDFYRVDEAAEGLGIDQCSPVRLRAAVVYELTFNLQSGHCFIPRDKLIDATARLCHAEQEEIEAQLLWLLERETVILEEISGKPVVYLAHLHRDENAVARDVSALLAMVLVAPKNMDKLILQAEKTHDIKYAEKQKQALKLCFTSAISLITGGPGTGKTTAILGIISMLKAYGLSVLLCAPTGRAAKKMTELCGEEAKTLHRLLEATYSKEAGIMKFKRNQDNPLKADVIIVDEASMIDISLASSLLSALQSHTRIIFIGDADQLPPVWAGSVFADLLSCDFIPSVKLTEIFRQAQGSEIIMNAHKINSGVVPELYKNVGDFYFSSCHTAEDTVSEVATLVSKRIPAKFGIDPQNIQVICPTRQQMCGTQSMNKLLQEYLNPAEENKAEVRSQTGVFRVGDRVMQVKNNYDILWQSYKTAEIGTGIFNGDTGVIMLIDKQEKIIAVRFDDRDAAYAFDDLFQLEPAYAITAHKSQGSEYEAVILPIFTAPERLLTRNILYTAATRAKKLLIIVGRAETIKKMVETNHKNRRYGALKFRLRERFDERQPSKAAKLACNEDS